MGLAPSGRLCAWSARPHRVHLPSRFRRPSLGDSTQPRHSVCSAHQAHSCLASLALAVFPASNAQSPDSQGKDPPPLHGVRVTDVGQERRASGLLCSLSTLGSTLPRPGAGGGGTASRTWLSPPRPGLSGWTEEGGARGQRKSLEG